MARLCAGCSGPTTEVRPILPPRVAGADQCPARAFLLDVTRIGDTATYWGAFPLSCELLILSAVPYRLSPCWVQLPALSGGVGSAPCWVALLVVGQRASGSESNIINAS